MRITALLFGLGLTLPLAWGSQPVWGMKVQAFDALGIAVGLVGIVAFLRSSTRRAADLLPLLFPLALGLSLLASEHPWAGRGVVLRSLYLAGLATSVTVILRAYPPLKDWLCRGWRAGWLMVLLGTALGVIGFYAGYRNPEQNPFLFQYGSLPSGAYPRICSTFLNSNLMCNYLIVTMGLLVELRLQVLLLIGGLFTLSPGLGPLVLNFCLLRSSTGAKALGVLAALLFYLASWTYVSEVLQGQFRLSARAQCWSQAAQQWGQHPFLGQGPGQCRVEVYWTDPDGRPGYLSDPHNAPLSVLAQGGLLSFLVLAGLTLRKPLRANRQLALAVLLAIWLDGLTGSFEDARHIWVGLGMLGADIGTEPPSQPPQSL